jgi:hypothetical protein
VLCPCKKNRVIVGGKPGIFLETTQNLVAASNAATVAQAVTAMAPAAPVADKEMHVRWCFVWDSVAAQPLRNRDYVADVAGVRQSGKTDGDGYAKIETDGGQPVEIHVLFASPKRKLKPYQGV